MFLDAFYPVMTGAVIQSHQYSVLPYRHHIYLFCGMTVMGFTGTLRAFHWADAIVARILALYVFLTTAGAGWPNRSIVASRSHRQARVMKLKILGLGLDSHDCRLKHSSQKR